MIAPPARLLFAASLVCMTACASAAPRGGGGRGPGDGGPPGPPRAQLFVSPMGEPFRAPPAAPYPSQAWFEAADVDHDGALSRAEFRADAERWFKTLDRDSDGTIDGFEIGDYEAGLPEMAPELQPLRVGEGQDPTLGQPPGSGPREIAAPRTAPLRGGFSALRGVAPYGLLNLPEPVSGSDTDLDRKVSRAEFLKVADLRFTALDPAGQGVLRLAGLPKSQVQAQREAREAAEAKRRRNTPPRPFIRTPPSPGLLDAPSP